MLHSIFALDLYCLVLALCVILCTIDGNCVSCQWVRSLTQLTNKRRLPIGSFWPERTGFVFVFFFGFQKWQRRGHDVCHIAALNLSNYSFTLSLCKPEFCLKPQNICTSLSVYSILLFNIFPLARMRERCSMKWESHYYYMWVSYQALFL